MASLPLGPHHPPDTIHQHDPLNLAPPPPRRQSEMDSDKEMIPAVVEGNDQVTGHIISTTIGGKNGEPKRLTGASPELINRLIPEHVRRQSGLSFPLSTGT